MNLKQPSPSTTFIDLRTSLYLQCLSPLDPSTGFFLQSIIYIILFHPPIFQNISLFKHNYNSMITSKKFNMSSLNSSKIQSMFKFPPVSYILKIFIHSLTDQLIDCIKVCFFSNQYSNQVLALDDFLALWIDSMFQALFVHFLLQIWNQPFLQGVLGSGVLRPQSRMLIMIILRLFQWTELLQIQDYKVFI